MYKNIQIECERVKCCSMVIGKSLQAPDWSPWELKKAKNWPFQTNFPRFQYVRGYFHWGHSHYQDLADQNHFPPVPGTHFQCVPSHNFRSSRKNHFPSVLTGTVRRSFRYGPKTGWRKDFECRCKNWQLDSRFLGSSSWVVTWRERQEDTGSFAEMALGKSGTRWKFGSPHPWL